MTINNVTVHKRGSALSCACSHAVSSVSYGFSDGLSGVPHRTRPLLLILPLLLIISIPFTHGLMAPHPICSPSIHQNWLGRSSRRSVTASTLHHPPLSRSGGPPFSSAPASLLRMVFSSPDAIVEQASTEEILDQILDESLRFSARRPIMIQLDPSSKAIWKNWKGTVFAETWTSCVTHVMWAITVYLLLKRYPVIETGLAGFDRLWGQVLSVTTFTISFFVNQSYQVFRTCLRICRTLQGRLNDLSMSIAGCAERMETPPSSSSSTMDMNNIIKNNNSSNNASATSCFTPGSRKVLQVVSRYVRLFNILTYASLARSHRPLVTPLGMRRMVSRGLLTDQERKILVDNSKNLPATQRHNAVLMWIFRIVIEARTAGYIDGGFGFEQQVMAKVQEIRGQSNSMESVLKGRMPFAYAHIVQVLVDVVLWMYPVMAYTSGTSFTVGVIGTILLTLAYQGLFDLAKKFLDPFHNENFWLGEDPLVVNTLLAETNAGSVRWRYCLEDMPIPYRVLKSGALEDYLLPEEGYTVQEARERQEIKDEQKKELQLLLEQQQRDQNLVGKNTFVGWRSILTEEELKEEELEELSSSDAEDEIEETRRILSAPPGLDFVPGLDDDGESLEFYFRDNMNANNNNNNNSTWRGSGADEDKDTFEDFLEASEEDYKKKTAEV